MSHRESCIEAESNEHSDVRPADDTGDGERCCARAKRAGGEHADGEHHYCKRQNGLGQHDKKHASGLGQLDQGLCRVNRVLLIGPDLVIIRAVLLRTCGRGAVGCVVGR